MVVAAVTQTCLVVFKLHLQMPGRCVTVREIRPAEILGWVRKIHVPELSGIQRSGE